MPVADAVDLLKTHFGGTLQSRDEVRKSVNTYQIIVITEFALVYNLSFDVIVPVFMDNFNATDTRNLLLWTCFLIWRTKYISYFLVYFTCKAHDHMKTHFYLSGEKL